MDDIVGGIAATRPVTMYYMVKQTITVRIDPEVRDEALAAHVEPHHRWQVEHIRQGLREANAGKFASKASVNRVIARLRRT
jgi:hypothetical protein